VSRNSFAVAVLAVTVVAGAAAAAPPATCPSSITEGARKHVLDNASLYDGPPSEMADLMPVRAGAVDRWSLGNADPYLICKFSGTSKVVTFHAVGAKVCEAGKKPFQAYCKN
jgi:hypothetical protein